ncbi:MAG: hypothetical protein IJ265_12375 [Oscillospiraceae bacterium]|nr:hypothetical protein [Oscillospiraceae bacterium]
MAFSENVIEHAKYAEGKFSYYTEIICDTAEDIPDPVEHPSWEVGSKLFVLENGGSSYRLSNGRKWMKVNFDKFGEGGDGSFDPDQYYTAEQTDALLTAVQQTVDETASGLSAVNVRQQNMSRNVVASTEAEVREALQFAADHPGCYLSLTLAAGLHATVPTLYIRNAVVYIAGTQTGGVNTSTITFEQTSTTSNLHVQNTSLSIQNINLNGCHKNSTAGYGVVRVEQGSSLHCEGVKFGQAEGSQNFGNNIEVQISSRAYIKNTEFCLQNTTDARASGIYLFGNSEAVSQNCTMSADSAVQNIARLEAGSSYNQIGGSYDVYMAAGHASMYLVNGVQKVPADLTALAPADLLLNEMPEQLETMESDTENTEMM